MFAVHCCMWPRYHPRTRFTICAITAIRHRHSHIRVSKPLCFFMQPSASLHAHQSREKEEAHSCRNMAQGSLNAVLEKIFGINTGFLGNVASQALKAVGFRGFAESVNDKHMHGWASMCKKGGVLNTPLTPYIDAELLAHDHLSINGRLIETTGFKYEFPLLTEETLRPQLATYIQQGLFPAVI